MPEPDFFNPEILPPPLEKPEANLPPNPFASGIDDIPLKDMGLETPVSPHKSMRSRVLLAIFLVIGIFLLAATAVGFFVINDPPAEVVKLSLERLNAVSSLHTVFEINVSGSPSKQTSLQHSDPLWWFASVLSAGVHSEAVSAIPSADSVRSFSAKLTANADEVDRGTPQARSATVGEASFSLNEEGKTVTGSVSAELRTFGIKKLYAQLISFVLPSELGADQTNKEIAPYFHKWIKFDAESLQQLAGQKEQKAPEQAFTPEEQQRLLVKLSHAIALKRVGAEEIDGTSTFHYRTEFVRPALDDFLFEFVDIVSHKNVLGSADSFGDPGKIREDIKKGLDDFFANNTLSAELWVSRWDLLPRKIVLTFEARKDAKTVATVNASILWSKFNEPVTIVEPADALDFQEVLKNISSVTSDILPSPPSAPQNPDDARRKTLQVMAAVLELIYRGQYNGKVPSTNNILVHISKDIAPCKELIATGILHDCPSDPAGSPHFYGYQSDGKSYELTAALDDHSASDCMMQGSVCLYVIHDGKVVSHK